MWPSSIISGFTTLIPKSSETPETPTDLRPITVLRVLYRAWARIRACQLNVLWQEQFAHKGMWGGRTSRGAEPLLLDVALDLEVTSAAHVAGLSFDLSKAFDRVPRELLGKILAKMSMPGCVFRPYMYMLRNATRRYKLGASLDASQPLYGGILQGCPLAMLSMNAICNIWLRSLEATIPCFPRSYVDDVSVTVMEDSPEALINACRDVYSCSTKFVNATGGKINAKKCFTFGSPAVKGSISDDITHLDEFRLVGGSFVSRSDNSVSPTTLELQRMNAWLKTAQRARHLPCSWHDRCGCLSRTRSQFTWGAGTHRLPETKTHENELTKLRSAIMRCLLRRDYYHANPSLYFSLLASPSLNPFFCRVVDGLTLVWRVMWSTDRVATFRILFHSSALKSNDGPIARLRQIDALPGFVGVVQNMFTRTQSDYGAWLHHIRDVWRIEQWRKVSRDRPSFRGIEKGICRAETLQYLRRLENEGRSTDAVTTIQMEQARMHAAILRLLLTGGLMTQDVVTRHRVNQTTDCDCELGGPQTIEHISWNCTHHTIKRQPIHHLLKRIQKSKPCFQYATILTPADYDLSEHLTLIQSTIIHIWQDTIRMYLQGEQPLDSSIDPTSSSSQTPSHNRSVSEGLHENGHYIVGIPGGDGIYCRKCGKHVTEVRHRRLKISKTKCTQANLPETQWLDRPGFSDNPRRLLGLFTDMAQFCHNHKLAWNGTVNRKGPSTVGRIQCLKCCKSWPWDNRHNMQRADCPTTDGMHLPANWISLEFALSYPDEAVFFLSQLHGVTSNVTAAASSSTSTANASSASSSNIDTSSTPVVRFRLRQKTRINSTPALQISSTTTNPHPVADRAIATEHESAFIPIVGSFSHFDDMG